MYISSFNLHSTPEATNLHRSLYPGMDKLRFSEEMQLTQGHPAYKRQNQVLNPGLLMAKLILPITD